MKNKTRNNRQSSLWNKRENVFVVSGSTAVILIALYFIYNELKKKTEKYTPGPNPIIYWLETPGFVFPSRNDYQSYSSGYSTTNIGKGMFQIEGSPGNSIETATGKYEPSSKMFGTGSGTASFPISDYQWTDKYSKTWNTDGNGANNRWYQNLDDMKGVLIRKSDGAVFSTWTEKKKLKTVRYWGFVKGGTPLAEFSLVGLTFSGISQM